jgi:hypothetical protein
MRTPWAKCWRDILLRIDGAKKHGSVHFYGKGDNTSAVSIPLDQ